MNAKVRKTNIESLLFFDIETAARNKKLDPKSKEFELFAWSLRDKVTGEIPDKKVVQETYANTAALKPEFNRIVCITVGNVKNGVLNIKTFKGGQAYNIKKFYASLNNSGLVPCGYNVIAYDLSVLRLKALEEGIGDLLLDKFSDSNKRPWHMTDVVLDLIDVVKGTYYNNISLDNACYLAGVSSPKEGEIKGPEVSKAYYAGKLDKIAEYCERDVEATARLFLKLASSKYEIKEVVIHPDVTTGVVVEEKKPLIERIFTKGQIDPEDYDELLKVAKGKTAKEKQELCDIVKKTLLSKHKKTLDEDEISVLDAIKKVK